MHTTRHVQAFVSRIDYRVDVDTLHREKTSSLGVNDIGRVEISTGHPIFFDNYRVNSATGSFVLVDPQTNVTVAAGMIRGEVREVERPKPEAGVSTDVVWQGWNIAREAREEQNGHRAGVIWLTGLSGAGKTTIARAVERRLFERGCRTMLLDGDNLRHGLCGDLGFSPEDRAENIRRAGEVARLFFEQGCVVLCAFVSPYQKDRDRVRGLLPEGRFVEIWVRAPLETLRGRDTKGLYARAQVGAVSQFTGMTAPYEPPPAPELALDTDRLEVEEAVARVLSALESAGWIKG
jgi:bifunctional enzyme CysN/CysC